jgi:anti-sigma-K factor RskA
MRDNERIGVDERELDDLALEALAEAYAATPPPELRGRVLADVSRAGGGKRTRSALTRWRIAGALAAGIALVLGGLLARESDRAALQRMQIAALAESKAELESALEAQGRTLVGLRTALEAQGKVLEVLDAPQVRMAALAPQEGFAGSGRVVVDPESGEAAIVLTDMREPGAGKTYELWAIRADKPPEPAGLLDVRGAGHVARVDTVPRPREVVAFAVSIEPAGGSTSPTGPIVLVGNLT